MSFPSEMDKTLYAGTSSYGTFYLTGRPRQNASARAGPIPGTVEKYVEAVLNFLVWYEQEEGAPLQMVALTPIALIGYGNHLQHEQHRHQSCRICRTCCICCMCC